MLGSRLFARTSVALDRRLSSAVSSTRTLAVSPTIQKLIAIIRSETNAVKGTVNNALANLDKWTRVSRPTLSPVLAGC